MATPGAADDCRRATPLLEPRSHSDPDAPSVSASRGAVPAAATSGPSQTPSTAPYYSFRNIFASASDLEPSQINNIASSVRSNPCFRTSFLWGAALGGAFSLHRLKQRGSPLHALNDGVLAGMGTFGLQWYLCRAAEVDKRTALKAYYLRERLSSGGDDSTSPNAGDGAEEEWRRDLRRSTEYHNLPTVEERPGPSK